MLSIFLSRLLCLICCFHFLHRYSHSNTLPILKQKHAHTITRVQSVLHIEWHLFYQMTATVVALNSRVQLYARIVIIHLHEFHGLG